MFLFNHMKTKAMDDLDDLTESCEAASESPELPYPSSEDVLLLITQLQADCKDSFSLLKIRKAVQSYKRLIELKICCCELLRRQIEKMEDKVTGLQKELSETKELKLQLEHEKVEQEQELCNARFALKQEKEKREKADWLCEKNKEQLNRKEEQYNKEVKANQQLKNSLRILHMELKTLRNNLDQLQETQDRHKEAVRRAKKMEDHLQKLELENFKLKVAIEKQAEENQQLQKNLFSTNMELLSLKNIEKKYLKLQKNKKKMEQELLTLKCPIEKNGVEHGRVQQYKQEIEERERQDLAEKLQQVDQLLQTQAEIRSQMEVKIKCLETELSEMKSQEESYKVQLDMYQKTCLEGFQITRSLSNQLKMAEEKLEEAGRELLREKWRNRTLLGTHSARPFLQPPCVGIHSSSWLLNQRLMPSRNLVAPASDPWPSAERVHSLETRVSYTLF